MDCVARFQSHGYLAVKQGLAADEVDELLAALTSLIDKSRGAEIQLERGRRVPSDELSAFDAVRKFQSPGQYDERILASAQRPPLMAAVRCLLGNDDAYLWNTLALMKPPGGGREKPWHQDNAFFKLKPGSPILGVWIALDEATPQNGCMHVIPGSHQRGPVVHFKRRDFQICDTDVRRTDQVAVPLPPGGMLFFDGLIHHGTPANRTDTRRRALQFHYITPETAAVDEEEIRRVFGSEGKDVQC
jgi:ectoine hydroxylase-related dioxygenase (phytanoyl-CoA dioxygenase family)